MTTTNKQLTALEQVIDECIKAGNIKNTEGMSFELKGLMIINALEGYAAKQPLDRFVKTIDEQQQVIDKLVKQLTGMDNCECMFVKDERIWCCPRCSALASAKELEAK